MFSVLIVNGLDFPEDVLFLRFHWRLILSISDLFVLDHCLELFDLLGVRIGLVVKILGNIEFGLDIGPVESQLLNPLRIRLSRFLRFFLFIRKFRRWLLIRCAPIVDELLSLFELKL